MPGRALRAKDLLAKIQPILPSLQRSSKLSELHKSQHDVKIGICVSGGPDSMALAHLFSTMPVIESMRVLPLGIIVDHHVRPGSTEEALRVQAELRKMAVPSMILDISWPEGSHPLRWSNFESEARERRYRLIASTAIQNQIRHIFTGHHLDDQIETGLMRLADQKHNDLLGLRGISSSSSIPCCDDILGAHEEQIRVHLKSPRLHEQEVSGRPGGPKGVTLRIPNYPYSCFFPIGRLTLHRPLLTFTKADLLATCRQNNISFVSDATNYDPTFTRRNAVRVLRSSERLPKALQATRILELQKKADIQVEHTLSSGLRALESLLIRKLDLTSGILEVELPVVQSMNVVEKRGLSNALSRLTSIVTPFPRSEMPLQVPEDVFSNLLAAANDCPDSANQEATRRDHPSSFSFRRVVFTKLYSKTKRWTLSRQPMRSIEIAENSWRLPLDAGIKLSDNGAEEYSTIWKLWDNRFWIRLSCTSRHILEDIYVCPLTEERLRNLYAALSNRNTPHTNKQLAKLKRVLSKSAPGKSRYTLPVLVLGNEIIEFPTLRLRNLGAGIPEGVEFHSEIRYKTVSSIDRLRMSCNTSRHTSSKPRTMLLSDCLDMSKH